ncbi:MAG: ribonuclease P Rpr2/Rpp21/SNM1 subunit [Fibrobacterales bacterium]
MSEIEKKSESEIEPMIEKKSEIDTKVEVEEKVEIETKPVIEEKPEIEAKPEVEKKVEIEEKSEIDTKSEVEEKAEIDTKSEIEKRPSKNEVLEELKRVAAQYNFEYFQKRQFSHYAQGMDCKEVARAFGSWKKGLAAAGVSSFPEKVKKKKYRQEATYETLLVEMIRVWMDIGKMPEENEWKEHSKLFPAFLYCKIFGSWEKATEEAKKMPEAVMEIVTPVEDEAAANKPNTSMFHRHTIPEKLEEKVLARERNKCGNCGRIQIEEEGVTVKVVYIKSPSKGGKLVMSNLKTLCNICIDESKSRRRWY